ncbi:hypothetical protein H8R23_13660 [Flavobacterium sp. F-380]|uniref:Uncharacterized protein n=1 Tax=Flavobacterium kayseriense TaxID=2764714 RepID=A0ABR7JA89_9FLAO|nr:hypothetical protein [Flavobacterium kayseriense]MBC5842458.1 hypothetical protein [Flavobacterium kayseriense]MBC5848988.1 hypothetical protein [Flavobacterium kayseriense]
MKTLITVFALFLMNSLFAQSTTYHSGDNLGKEKLAGTWFIAGVKTDILFFEPSAVTFAKVHRELKKALDFYSLKYDEPFKDETILSSLTNSLADFELMDLAIQGKKSEVSMMWKSDLVIIAWYCNVDAYGMSIKEL